MDKDTKTACLIKHLLDLAKMYPGLEPLQLGYMAFGQPVLDALSHAIEEYRYNLQSPVFIEKKDATDHVSILSATS